MSKLQCQFKAARMNAMHIAIDSRVPDTFLQAVPIIVVWIERLCSESWAPCSSQDPGGTDKWRRSVCSRRVAECAASTIAMLEAKRVAVV